MNSLMDLACLLRSSVNASQRTRTSKSVIASLRSTSKKWSPSGVLESQWVPIDPELWRIENYLDFLAERRRLLAVETNRRMEELLHGDTRWFESAAKPEPAPMAVPSGITSDDEEAEPEVLNEWVESQGLPRGQMSFDYTDPDTVEQLAVFDLAWLMAYRPN